MPRTVYQLTNVTKGEVYIGMTPDPIKETVERLSSSKPPSLADWDFDSEEIGTDQVQSFQDDEDAVRFYAGLWDALKRGSWKTVQCESDCTPAPSHGKDGGLIVPCDMDCEAHRKSGPFEGS